MFCAHHRESFKVTEWRGDSCIRLLSSCQTEQYLPAAIQWRTLIVREVVVTVVVATHRCHRAAPLKQKQMHLQFYPAECEHI
jgi:hypothetical protein